MTPVSRTTRGFTLIELMVVVVITGVIVMLGLFGVRKYLFASKSAEANSMILQIKANQENWKDETFKYLTVSSNIETVYPQGSVGKLGRRKFAWDNPGHGDHTAWLRLGVASANPVQFGYAVVAGDVGGSPPTPVGLPGAALGWPAPTGPWYVVRASADQNGNGKLSYFVASSFTAEVRIENEDE